MKKLEQSLTFHSSDCEIHNIKKLVYEGEVLCPRCQNEEESQRVISGLVAKHENRNTSILKTKSLFSDKTLLVARFDTYIRNVVDGSEEKKNKELAWQYANRLKTGEKFNIVMQGKQGSGKSHLSYSILYYLNEEITNASCLFIDFSEMLREIRKSFTYKDHPYNEFHFVNLLSKVDFLVLDDLGAETGATETDKAASDFVHRVLKDIANGRQDKVTITTTNLSGKGLTKMYDAKTVSRLFKRPEYIVFEHATDKRIAKLPF